MWATHAGRACSLGRQVSDRVVDLSHHAGRLGYHGDRLRADAHLFIASGCVLTSTITSVASTVSHRTADATIATIATATASANATSCF